MPSCMQDHVVIGHVNRPRASIHKEDTYWLNLIIHSLTGTGILIMKLIWSSDHLRFIMGISYTSKMLSL